MSIRICVGAGSDAPVYSKQGWLCNDLPEAAKIYGSIDIIGPCWELTGIVSDTVDEIFAKGMWEHMTYTEAIKSLKEWVRILKPNGFVTIEAPDVDEYLRRYLAIKLNPTCCAGEGHDGGATGEPEDFDACRGPDRWLRRVLWGWQRYPGDEHRSGWTKSLLEYYLGKYFSKRYEVRKMAYSFEKDDPDAKIRHLWARAWKE